MDLHINFDQKKHNLKQFPAPNNDYGQFKVSFTNLVKCTPYGIWNVPLMVYQDHHYKQDFPLCVKLRMKWPVHYNLPWHGICRYTPFYGVIFHQFWIIQQKLWFFMSFLRYNLRITLFFFYKKLVIRNPGLRRQKN